MERSATSTPTPPWACWLLNQSWGLTLLVLWLTTLRVVEGCSFSVVPAIAAVVSAPTLTTDASLPNIPLAVVSIQFGNAVPPGGTVTVEGCHSTADVFLSLSGATPPPPLPASNSDHPVPVGFDLHVKFSAQLDPFEASVLRIRNCSLHIVTIERGSSSVGAATAATLMPSRIMFIGGRVTAYVKLDCSFVSVTFSDVFSHTPLAPASSAAALSGAGVAMQTAFALVAAVSSSSVVNVTLQLLDASIEWTHTSFPSWALQTEMVYSYVFFLPYAVPGLVVDVQRSNISIHWLPPNATTISALIVVYLGTNDATVRMLHTIVNMSAVGVVGLIKSTDAKHSTLMLQNTTVSITLWVKSYMMACGAFLFLVRQPQMTEITMDHVTAVLSFYPFVSSISNASMSIQSDARLIIVDQSVNTSVMIRNITFRGVVGAQPLGGGGAAVAFPCMSLVVTMATVGITGAQGLTVIVEAFSVMAVEVGKNDNQLSLCQTENVFLGQIATKMTLLTVSAHVVAVSGMISDIHVALTDVKHSLDMGPFPCGGVSTPAFVTLGGGSKEKVPGSDFGMISKLFVASASVMLGTSSVSGLGNIPASDIVVGGNALVSQLVGIVLQQAAASMSSTGFSGVSANLMNMSSVSVSLLRAVCDGIPNNTAVFSTRSFARDNLGGGIIAPAGSVVVAHVVVASCFLQRSIRISVAETGSSSATTSPSARMIATLPFAFPMVSMGSVVLDVATVASGMSLLDVSVTSIGINSPPSFVTTGLPFYTLVSLANVSLSGGSSSSPPPSSLVSIQFDGTLGRTLVVVDAVVSLSSIAAPLLVTPTTNQSKRSMAWLFHDVHYRSYSGVGAATTSAPLIAVGPHATDVYHPRSITGIAVSVDCVSRDGGPIPRRSVISPHAVVTPGAVTYNNAVAWTCAAPLLSYTPDLWLQAHVSIQVQASSGAPQELQIIFTVFYVIAAPFRGSTVGISQAVNRFLQLYRSRRNCGGEESSNVSSPFLSSPMDNPLQMSIGSAASTSTTAATALMATPEDIQSAAGAVVGSIVLIACHALVVFLVGLVHTVASQHGRQRAAAVGPCSSRTVAMAWVASGGHVACFAAAYTSLLQPLAAGTTMLAIVMGSTWFAHRVVNIVALAGLVTVCGPLALWMHRILWVWRQPHRFPFRSVVKRLPPLLPRQSHEPDGPAATVRRCWLVNAVLRNSRRQQRWILRAADSGPRMTASERRTSMMFRVIIEPFRSQRVWYFAVDAWWSLAMGVVSGVANTVAIGGGDDGSSCGDGALAAGVKAWGYVQVGLSCAVVASVASLRPFTDSFEWILGASVAVMGAAAVLLPLISGLPQVTIAAEWLNATGLVLGLTAPLKQLVPLVFRAIAVVVMLSSSSHDNDGVGVGRGSPNYSGVVRRQRRQRRDGPAELQLQKPQHGSTDGNTSWIPTEQSALAAVVELICRHQRQREQQRVKLDLIEV